MTTLQAPSELLTSLIQEPAAMNSTVNGLPGFKISHMSPGMEANRDYFGHPEWARNYFNACHRDECFRSRWQAATGSWDDKIVVDIGCGPGNVYATLHGQPKLLIGVDVSDGALAMAQEVGYTPLLADAQALPLKSGFADLVVVNATLHHCDDMSRVLSEAARLVRPGGLLVTDHDPQRTAWRFRYLGLLLWRLRLPIYRFIGRGGHATAAEQSCALATEVHHKIGDGVTPDFFHQILEPLGFKVSVFPHNHDLGADVLAGNYGRAQTKYRFAQWVSGINPNTPEAALTLMCVATRQA